MIVNYGWYILIGGNDDPKWWLWSPATMIWDFMIRDCRRSKLQARVAAGEWWPDVVIFTSASNKSSHDRSHEGGTSASRTLTFEDSSPLLIVLDLFTILLTIFTWFRHYWSLTTYDLSISTRNCSLFEPHYLALPNWMSIGLVVWLNHIIEPYGGLLNLLNHVIKPNRTRKTYLNGSVTILHTSLILNASKYHIVKPYLNHIIDIGLLNAQMFTASGGLARSQGVTMEERQGCQNLLETDLGVASLVVLVMIAVFISDNGFNDNCQWWLQ